MKYYLIKSRHNQKSKARRHVILFPPVYIFPCKLELISRRANKEEIALSLSPDQIRSSKMAVHYFWIIRQGKLISETIVVVPNARLGHQIWMCIFWIMWQGMKIPNLIYETIFWTQVQVDSSTNVCTFFWIRCKGSFHLRFSGIRPLRGSPPPLLTENHWGKKKVFFLSGIGGYPPLNGKSM